MSRKVLVSLVSDQTLPNVELIKEFQSEINHHLLIHSKEKIDQVNWILQACQLNDESMYSLLEVDVFNIEDIENKLKSYAFNDDEYILNITGGTKLMILVLQEFFRNYGAKIFYLTGKNCEYIKTFPINGKRRFKLESKIALDEYLAAYGFIIKSKGRIQRDFEQSKRIFKLVKDGGDLSVTRKITRGAKMSISSQIEIKDFISEIGFKPNIEGELSKQETKYLTGEWFEEYVYLALINEFGFSEDEIGIGYQLRKKDTPNELDIMFVLSHKLYIIECKTSVFNRVIINEKEKNKNLLGEIIYKSDALKNKFGLFANTYVLTLSELKDDTGNPLNENKEYFNRAELSKVKIISRKDIFSNKTLKEILDIH